MKTREYYSKRTNSSEKEMHAKQELEALKISKQEYSTNISEAQEYSNEKNGACLSPRLVLKHKTVLLVFTSVFKKILKH